MDLSYFSDMNRLLKIISDALIEIDFYEKKHQKIKKIYFSNDEIGYPCGIRRRSIRKDLYED